MTRTIPIGRLLAIMKRSWKWFFIAALLVAWYGIPTARKLYYDARVRQLCTKDGGARVHEQVHLPPNSLERLNTLHIPMKSQAKDTDDYVINWDVHWFTDQPSSNSDIGLRRDRFEIIRQRDSKVLGETVSYSRIGGDPIGPWESSSYRCPASADDRELVRLVFVR